MLKKLFSHTFLYALGPQIPRVLNILLLPIITQYLTPEDYGIQGTILSYAGILAGIKTLGFDVLFVNSFFKRKKNWKIYWRVYFGGLILWQLIFVFIQFCILYFLMPDEAKNNRPLILLLIIAPNFLFSIINNLGSRYYQLKQQPKFIAVTSIVSGFSVILVTFYTIVTLKLGYLGWFYASATGTFIQFLFFCYPILIKHKIMPLFVNKKDFWKKYLKIALPTVLHNYSSYLLNSSDRVVLDRMNVSINSIGLYNIAYIFGNYFNIFGEAVSMATGPLLTKLYSKKNKAAENHVRVISFFLQILFLYLAVNISLWIKEIFSLVISNKSLQSGYYLTILIIMGYSYRPMYMASVSKLFFLEKTNMLWKISFLGGIFNLLFNLILIPFWGIDAAAVTTFISLMYIGFAGFFLKEFKKNNNIKFFPVLWIILILLCTIIIFLLKDSDIIYKIAISCGLTVFVGILYFKNKAKINTIDI